MMNIDVNSPVNETGSETALNLTYVLSYRAPDYIRTETLILALRACPGLQLSIARNEQSGLRRYAQTWRALRALPSANTGAYLLGFRGHEIFWLVRWLSRGRPLILDALMSPYAALRHERPGNWLRKAMAALIFPFERSALKRADLVLTDTQLHAEFYARTFNLPLDHFFAVPVGAIEMEARPTDQSTVLGSDPTFHVLFYGSFLSLHGVEVILDAASKLLDLPVQFDFIGGNAAQARWLAQKCRSSGVTRFTHRRWVPFEHLLRVDIPEADLCLGGPFGGTPQALRVVTGKTSQFLSLGRPTVIGRIDEDYGFINQVNCLLTEQADADALALTIRWAFENRSSLPGIGARGRALYFQRLSSRVITERLTRALRHVIKGFEAKSSA